MCHNMMYIWCNILHHARDPDDEVLSKVSKFADHTKLCTTVGDSEGAKILQEEERSDGHRTSKCSLIWKFATLRMFV